MIKYIPQEQSLKTYKFYFQTGKGGCLGTNYYSYLLIPGGLKQTKMLVPNCNKRCLHGLGTKGISFSGLFKAGTADNTYFSADYYCGEGLGYSEPLAEDKTIGKDGQRPVICKTISNSK